MTATEQRTKALARANHRRSQVVKLRRQVLAGQTDLATLFLNPPDDIHHLALLDVFGLGRAATGRSKTTWRQTLGNRALAANVNLLMPIGAASQQSRIWAANQLTPSRPVSRGRPQLSGRRQHRRDPSMLPAHPFQTWLRSLPGTRHDIAAATGQSPRRIHALLTHDQDRINIATVDKVFTRFGDPGLLHELYPLDDTERQAA